MIKRRTKNLKFKQNLKHALDEGFVCYSVVREKLQHRQFTKDWWLGEFGYCQEVRQELARSQHFGNGTFKDLSFEDF